MFLYVYFNVVFTQSAKRQVILIRNCVHHNSKKTKTYRARRLLDSAQAKSLADIENTVLQVAKALENL